MATLSLFATVLVPQIMLFLFPENPAFGILGSSHGRNPGGERGSLHEEMTSANIEFMTFLYTAVTTPLFSSCCTIFITYVMVWLHPDSPLKCT